MILALAATGLRAWVEFNKQDLIIEKGVSGYKSAASKLNLVLAVCIVILAIQFIKFLVGFSKKAMEDSASKKTKNNAAQSSSPPLMTGGHLDPAEIRDYLSSQGHGEWSEYKPHLNCCIEIMDDMQDCIKRLDALLTMNEADSLYDTHDILLRSQQKICQNMRKLINFMLAVDIDGPGSDKEIIKRFEKCEEDSKELLSNVNEFVISISDFLNKQGEDNSSIEMINIYKETILESLQEGDQGQAVQHLNE